MTDDTYSAEELAQADLLLAAQPRTRAECPPADTPCPWAAVCRNGLWVDWSTDGTPRETACWGDPGHTCLLHELDAHPGEWTLEAIGDLLGLSRQRVDQIIDRVLERLRRTQRTSLRDYLEDDIG